MGWIFHISTDFSLVIIEQSPWLQAKLVILQTVTGTGYVSWCLLTSQVYPTTSWAPLCNLLCFSKAVLES